jgi:hypothetical protein
MARILQKGCGKEIRGLDFPVARKIKSRLSAACCTIGISGRDVNKMHSSKSH